MKKAFAYTRVSGKGQLEGDGFDRQMGAINGYAAAYGIRVVEEFREEAVSGKTELENRPALQALFAALHSNGVKIVLIEKLDRLARDLMVQETIIADLKKHGFELLSVAEPDLCSDDASRKLVRQIFGAISEYERSMIVLKLKGARERMKARTGRCEGRKPYGSREGEKEVLALLIKWRSEEMAVDTIAEKLNEEGVKSRTGKLWYGATVNRILKAQQPRLHSM